MPSIKKEKVNQQRVDECKPVRIAGYIRVSKDPHLDKISPSAQENAIREYCERQESAWSVIKVFKDIDIKGDNPIVRPAWSDLEAGLARGDFDGVVVYEISRIGRVRWQVMKALDEASSKGYFIASVKENINTDGGSGDEIMSGLFAVFAQHERSVLSERLKNIHKKIAIDGGWWGGTTPLGFKLARKLDEKTGKVHSSLKVDKVSAEWVRKMYELRSKGWSYKAITHEMNRVGARGSNGGKLQPTSIKRILRAGIYRGQRIYRAGQGMGSHEVRYELDSSIERIVPVSLWRRVDAVEARNIGRYGVAGPRGIYTLSGLVVCGECGCNMVRMKRYDGPGKANGADYRCLRDKGHKVEACGTVGIREHVLSEIVMEQWVEKIDHERLVDAAREIEEEKGKDNIEVRLDGLGKRLGELKKREERLLEGYSRGLITDRQMREQNEGLTEQLSGLEREIAGIEAERDLGDSYSWETAEELLSAWDLLTEEEKREALTMFISQIEVSKWTGDSVRKGPRYKKLNEARVKVVWRT